MSHPKHILVCTDLSETSKGALHKAAAYGTHFGAKITLIHVYDPSPLVPPAAIPSPERMEEKIATELEDAIRRELRSIRDSIFPGVEGIELAIHRHPSPARAITQHAREEDVDLIIVGTHGRTGIAHMLIGSVAEKVVRHASCDVLAVRTVPR